MSVVAVSISFSSALRSVKPGRACLAWSFSNAVTVKKDMREIQPERWRLVDMTTWDKGRS
jgi:hypothetical protein